MVWSEWCACSLEMKAVPLRLTSGCHSFFPLLMHSNPSNVTHKQSEDGRRCFHNMP